MERFLLPCLSSTRHMMYIEVSTLIFFVAHTKEISTVENERERERKTTNKYIAVSKFFCFFSSVCHHLRLCLVSNKMQMQLQPRREETSSKAMFYMVESTRIEEKRYIDFIEYCRTTNGRKKKQR